MSHIGSFTVEASDGLHITAVYGERMDANVAFALVIPDNQLPRLVHWGRPLSHPETAVDLYDALRPQRVSGALDDTMWPSVLPTQSESWLGQTRLDVSRNGRHVFCRFVVNNIAIDENTIGVTVTAEDSDQGVGLIWQCELEESGLLRQRATIRNINSDKLEVSKVELGYNLPAGMAEILTTTGHHLRERSPQRQPLTNGRFERLSMAGRPDYDASLLMSVGTPGFGFEHGNVYSVHVAWSGNSVLSIERMPYAQSVLGGGEVLFDGEITLQQDSEYTTPWLYGSYGDGLNEVASRFHRHIRADHPEFTTRPRPVILNTWEAVYFNHDFDTLAALADKAAESGVERFVVDDGWFGSRRDDRAGLGDWEISPDVWPDGPKSLKALADHVHNKGMEFGLWFEPEMVNPDSNMFRNYPDWVLKPTDSRLPMEGRQQQVVDLTNPEAYNYIYSRMDALVTELGIDYIKWDHNKLVTEAVSPFSGRPAVHEQTLAVYRIYRDLKAAHPGLEIESCSSGGGRVDMGILQYADRIWVSDCVDPVERADIQRYTSLLVPPEMMGEHVGDSPAHSTHRTTSQEMRMATAFFGHFGIEWNLLKQPQEDIDKLALWVNEFKKHRQDFATGTVVHGDSDDSSVRLDGVVNSDGSGAVYRFTQLTTSATYPMGPVRLPGLDPDAVYRVTPLIDDQNLEWLQAGYTQLGWWNKSGVCLTGRALDTYGIRPPALHPEQAILFEAVKLQ